VLKLNSFNNANWQDFVRVCQAINSLDELNSFFDTLLTVSEKVELAKRLTILRELLISDRPQRELAKQLQVSLANITRGSNVLKNTHVDLKKILQVTDD
jgi:TrpR family trp operon transcriptional repressor